VQEVQRDAGRQQPRVDGGRVVNDQVEGMDRAVEDGLQAVEHGGVSGYAEGIGARAGGR